MDEPPPFALAFDSDGTDMNQSAPPPLTSLLVQRDQKLCRRYDEGIKLVEILDSDVKKVPEGTEHA